MSLSITQFPVGGFDSNFAYLIHSEESAFIIDPSGDMSAVYTYISTHGLHVAGIILTHTHHDHFDALPETCRQYGELPIYVYERGIDLVGEYETLMPLSDYQELILDGSPICILHTPGHTDDSICLFIDTEHAKTRVPHVITGDTLFVGGCGRTSAHQVKDLYESLAELRALPPETVVYPGHDYGSSATSTIAREIAENRFYQCKNFGEFQTLRLGA